MTKTLYILLIAAVFTLISCADETATERTTTPAQLHLSLSLLDGEPSTRALPGDPGIAEPAFVKPSHLYIMVLMQYGDKSYLTYKHISNSSWSDLNQDNISTYSGIQLNVFQDEYTTNNGYLFAIASTKELPGIETTLKSAANNVDLSGDAPICLNDVVTPQMIINSVTFNIPESADNADNKNTFLRSVYSTAGAVTFPARYAKDVTATLYHTATRLDIQWDATASAPATPYSYIVVKNLPTQGIHAFTPSGNSNSAGAGTYSHTITIDEGNKYMGRAYFYVPSLDSYTLNINNSQDDTPKGTNLTSGLTSAPWVRINLK